MARCGVRLVGRKNFGWREGHRAIPHDALLHPSVYERLALGAVLVHGDMIPYRPHALRHHRYVGTFWAHATMHRHAVRRMDAEGQQTRAPSRRRWG
jgi:hypothetical protein